MNLKKLICLLLALVMVVAMAACGNKTTEPNQTAQPGDNSTPATPAPTEPPKTDVQKGGTLNISCNTDVTTGLFTHDIASWQALMKTQPMYETLFRNVNGQVEPLLATGYEQDIDAKTYTIHLREGVKFHDGSDFNAEAVKWNLEYYREKASRGLFYLANLESVDVIDEYTVRLNLINWDITIIPSLTIYPGMMTSKVAFETIGQDAMNTTSPVGTGPYKLDNWENQVQMTYVRFDDYWGGEPNFDTVVISIMTEPLTIAAALQSGELDMVINGDVPMNEAITFDTYTQEWSAYSTLENMVFSSKNPESPLSNLKVRQAICTAIDVDVFNQALNNGAGTTTNQFGLSGQRWYNDDLNGLYASDIDAAKALMVEAGYADGFTIPIYYVGIPQQEAVATAIQDVLSELNITVEMVPGTVEYADHMYYFDEGILLHMMGCPVDLCCQFVSNFKTGATGFGQNALIHTEELDAIIDNAVSAKSLEEEGAYLQEANKVIIEDMCLWYPMYTNPNLTICNTNIKDSSVGDGYIDYCAIWREN